MTEKRPTPDGSAGKGRRKSAAPTIDLTATEIPPNIPRETSPATSEADPPPPHAAAAPEADPAPQSEPAFVPPPDTAQDLNKESHNESHREPRKSVRSALTMPILAAGLAGAAVMSVILLTLWLTGLLPIRFAGLTMTRARVTALEMQLQDLQKRPAAVADTKTVDALSQRVARMEESLTKISTADPAKDAALAERVTAADSAMKSLGVALAALNKRSDDVAAASTQAVQRAEAAEKAVIDLRASVQDVSKTANAGASTADLTPLQQRIAVLEQSSKTASSEIAKATASDTAARLALSAASLRDIVLRGAPFTAELAQAKSLGADDKTLAPLSSFAANGVPSDKSLAVELSTLLPGMIKAAGAPPASGGFIERLQANAAQLVRIRPVDAPAGDDAATVLARLEVDAARADIAAALADLAKLTDAQRAPAQGWIVKAQSRQAALAAARQFSADTARSLGSK
jgi:hypothetical protein